MGKGGVSLQISSWGRHDEGVTHLGSEQAAGHIPPKPPGDQKAEHGTPRTFRVGPCLWGLPLAG